MSDNSLLHLLVVLVLYSCGLFILFLVNELRIVQKGKPSWQWIERLYKDHPRLQRIRW